MTEEDYDYTSRFLLQCAELSPNLKVSKEKTQLQLLCFIEFLLKVPKSRKVHKKLICEMIVLRNEWGIQNSPVHAHLKNELTSMQEMVNLRSSSLLEQH
jgi:hypothetical protein